MMVIDIRRSIQNVVLRYIIHNKKFVVGRFIYNGNNIEILKYFRNWTNPNWSNMFKEKHIPKKKEIYNRVKLSRVYADNILNIMKKYSFNIKDKRVLEIGCFDMSLCCELLKSGAKRVIGTDVIEYYDNQRKNEKNVISNAGYLKYLRETIFKFYDSFVNDNIKFIEDDISNSLLSSNSFDFICSRDVLEHIHDPHNAFNNMFRILKKGGMCFHEYNPFFCLIGGHSLASLDFPWGHVRLNSHNFNKYVSKYRQTEAQLDINFYSKNLNRMSLENTRDYCIDSGFEVLDFIKFPREQDIDLISDEIYNQCKNNYPTISLSDLIVRKCILILLKP
ncbi:MAG: class I SAM-dependent methyltransferase [Candidatus Helarchaeota archaeon]